MEAVKYLLEFAGYIRTETMQKFQTGKDRLKKIEETKTEKKTYRKNLLYFLQNQKPAAGYMAI